MKIRLLFVNATDATGCLNAEANGILPEDSSAEATHTVWLWTHKVIDGAGNPADHFDYISQALSFQNAKNIHKQGVMSMLSKPQNCWQEVNQ